MCVPLFCLVIGLQGAEATAGNLLRAVQYDLRTAAWHLLEEGAPTNGISPDGTTLAMWAARKGNLPMLEALLSRSSEHRRNRADGYTLVMAAAESGDTHVFDYVTRQTGLGSLVSNQGYTLAMAAAKGGNEDIFIRVRNQFREREIQTKTRHGYNLLMAAAEGGNLKIFHWVLEQMPERADRMVRPATGETLLHYAVRGRNPRIVRELLNSGLEALVDAGDIDKTTPLHAAISSLSEITQADASSVQMSRRLADAEQVLRLLLLKGADPNRQDQKGYTPAHLLAKTRYFELIPALYAAGADFSLESREGQTPLDLARQHGQARMVAELENLKRILEE